MKTKTIKTPLMTALAFGPTSSSSGLVPKSSRTVQKPSTVLFQNTAFMVAKTSPFGLKNRGLTHYNAPLFTFRLKKRSALRAEISQI